MSTNYTVIERTALQPGDRLLALCLTQAEAEAVASRTPAGAACRLIGDSVTICDLALLYYGGECDQPVVLHHRHEGRWRVLPEPGEYAVVTADRRDDSSLELTPIMKQLCRRA